MIMKYSTLPLLLLMVTVHVVYCNKTTTPTTSDQDPSITSSTRKGLKTLFSLTNRFIDAVSDPSKGSVIVDIQNAIPDKNIFSETSGMTNKDWRVVFNEAGRHFISIYVCMFFGIFLFVVLPLVALIMMCCRACGNCSSKPSPEKHSGIKKNICIALYVVILVILMACTICFFLGNSLMYKMMSDKAAPEDNMMGRVQHNLDEIEHYILGTASQEMTNRIYKSLPTVADEANNAINGIGDQIETLMIEKAFVNETSLDKIFSLPGEMTELQTDLNQYDTSLLSTNQAETALTTKLTAIRDDLSNALNCTTCTPLRTKVNSDLVLQQSFTTIPAIPSDVKTSVDSIVNSDIFDQLNIGNSSYFDRFAILKNDSTSSIRDITTQLTGVNTTLLKYVDKARSYVDETINFTKIRKGLDSARDFIDKGASPLRTSGYVIGATFIVIIVCMLCGLLTSVGTCGGNSRSTFCTMLSVYLILFLGACFSLITCVLFLYGAITTSQGCRHVRDLSDRSVTVEFDNIIASIESNMTTVKISELFANCYAGKGFYESGNFSEEFDLQSKFNLKDYLDLADTINGSKSIGDQFSQITILNNKSKTLLNDLANSKLGTLKFDNLNTILTKDVLPSPLDDLISEITTFKATLTDTILIGKLDSSIADINALKAAELTVFITAVETLRTSVQGIVSILHNDQAESFTSRLSTLITDVKQMETTMNSKATADTLTKAVSQIIDDTFKQFETKMFQLGTYVANVKCKKPVVVIQSTIDIYCVDFMNPFNAYWFCTGWFLGFSLLGMLFAIKIAHYHMESGSCFEDANFDNYSGHSDRTYNSRRTQGSRNLGYQQEGYQMKQQPPRYQDPPHYQSNHDYVR